MMDIREFLEARLAEDEAVARAAEALDTNWPFWVEVDNEFDFDAANEFRSRLGPARVLRDVATGLGLLALHVQRPADDPETFSHGLYLSMATCAGCREVDPCRSLRLLAAPFADHPGYDPSWSLT